MATTFRLFENLTVKTKLGIGFSSLLALIFLIVLMGIASLNSTEERSMKVEHAKELETLLYAAQVQRILYIQSATDAHGEALTRAAQNIDHRLEADSTLYKDEEDLALLHDSRSIMTTYLNHVHSLMQEIKLTKVLTSELQTLWQAMNEQATQRLQDAKISDRVDDYEMAMQIKLGLADLYQSTAQRFETGRTNQSTNTPLDNLQAILAEMSDEGPYSAEKTKLSNTLYDYQATVNDYIDSAKNIQALRLQIGQLGSQIERNIKQLVTQQLQKRQSEASNTQISLIMMSVIALCIGLFATWGITRLVAPPLRQAVQVAEKIAKGDLTQEFNSHRQDEIGALLRALGHMQTSLRTLLGEIETSTTQLASASSQLSASAEQNLRDTQAQQEETDQVATAMNEMTVTVAEVAQNAEEASAAADTADTLTQEGIQGITDAASLIHNLADSVAQSATMIEQLQEASSSIDSVLDVINSVAEQTNLLALNAAIEAARAGEAGRGFAVVADEVRSLAQRTQDSTGEIGGLITRLQGYTQQSAEMMANSRSMAQENAANAEGAVRMLHQIGESVAHIQQMNQQIAAAAQEQSTVSEDINQRVTRVSEISSQNATASQEAANATESLAQLGHHLKASLSRFRL